MKQPFELITTGLPSNQIDTLKVVSFEHEKYIQIQSSVQYVWRRLTKKMRRETRKNELNTYADSKGSDQPMPSHRLTRAFVVREQYAWALKHVQAQNENSYWTKKKIIKID